MSRWLFWGVIMFCFSGCISPRVDAFLLGTGVGAGLTCMAVKGDVLCGRGTKNTALWERQDMSFPDASIPYDMY